MEGHLVVCGMGQVGYRVVTLLRQLGERATVITRESRDDWLRSADELGVRVLLGDARDSALLAEAGILQAQALIVATDQDAVNIEVALDARKMREDLPVVVRLFDQTLAQRLEETFGFRRALSMSSLAAPGFAAAAMGDNVAGSFTLDGRFWIVGQVRLDPSSDLNGMTVGEIARRHRLSVLTRGTDDDWEFAPGLNQTFRAGDALTVVADASDWAAFSHESRRAGKGIHRFLAVLQQARARLSPWSLVLELRSIWRSAPLPLRSVFVLLNVLIALSVVIFHWVMDLTFVDALYYIVGTVTTVGGGDVKLVSDELKLYVALVMLLGTLTVAILYSIVTDFVVTARFRQMVGSAGVAHEGHVLVVGLGNVGYRVVQQLWRSGQPVVAVDHDPGAEFAREVRAHTPVVVGDGRVPDTLRRAGIGRARAVIASTHDDAVNLAVGLTAKQLAPEARAVVRLFDADFARKVQSSLGMDVVMSASMVASPVFVAAALYPNVRHALVLDGRLIVLMEGTAGSEPGDRRPEGAAVDAPYAVLARRGPGQEPMVVDAGGPLARDERVLVAVWRPLTR